MKQQYDDWRYAYTSIPTLCPSEQVPDIGPIYTELSNLYFGSASGYRIKTLNDSTLLEDARSAMRAYSGLRWLVSDFQQDSKGIAFSFHVYTQSNLWC